MFWRALGNPNLLINLENADYFEIQGVKELDDYKVCVYYSGVSKIAFKGSFEECDLFLKQVENRTTFSATVALNELRKG
jgi:hypothetical protein